VEELGAEFIGCAIGTIHNDTEAREFSSGNDTTAEKIQILGVERGVGHEERRIFRRRLRAMSENIGFERFFYGIGKLHACVREELYAIVVVRIVGSGDDNASLEIVLADETSNARRGDDAGKGDGRASLRETSGEESGNVGAGFASVHADENVCGGALTEEIRGERTASSIKSGVVERRSAWNAANPIGSEKFFGHERLAGNP
jgi:hypothetical protein